MGLDMYLTARRYLRSWEKNDVETINQINEKFGLDKIKEDDFSHPIAISSMDFSVAYWRKSNAIHRWFVENVQERKDDCNEYWVSREQLQQLIDTCKLVAIDRDRAPELLPTADGFFFGSTAYDDSYYFEDLKYTINRLEKVLSIPAFKDCQFYYQASW